MKKNPLIIKILGASLKDVAKKAGFSPNYGCEEGKCGSCEMKVLLISKK